MGRRSWSWLRRKSYSLLDEAEAIANMSDTEEGQGGTNSANVTESIQVSETEGDVGGQIESVKSELAAEGQRSQVSPVLSVSPDDTSSQGLECPICLQPCVHPVELPCKHIFCFLCIKGVAMQGPHGRCAICRSNIPHNVLTHPRLKDVSQLYKHVKTTSGFEWFYEARGGGWWQYDERSIQELEKAFETGQTTCQLMIAGHLYEIDFPQMIQYRLNNRNLFRRMKRDVASAEKRGIAGIRLNQSRGGGDTLSTNNDGSGSTDTSRRGRGGRPGQSQRNSSQTPSDSSQPPSRPNTASGNNVIVLSDSDSDNERHGAEHVESDDPDYLEEEEDMDLGDEEELGESVDEEEEAEDELRDGARAPTRRSDRSNSSTNPTPPPNGIANGSSRNHNSSPNSNPNGRASRGARSDRTNAGSRSNKTDTSATESGSGGGGSSKNSRGVVEASSSTSSPSPQLLFDEIRTVLASTSTIHFSPVPVATELPPNLSLEHVGTNNNDGSSRTSSSSITTTSGLTCLLIGPGVRITVDQENPNRNRDDFL